MFFSNKKQAQALPLNTIVIALLVIIVLLVIVVFFTSSVGKTGDQIEQNDPGACSIQNPVIKGLGYVFAEYSTAQEGSNDKCQNEKDFVVVSVIPKNSEEYSYGGATFYKGAVCCATKNEAFIEHR